MAAATTTDTVEVAATAEAVVAMTTVEATEEEVVVVTAEAVATMTVADTEIEVAVATVGKQETMDEMNCKICCWNGAEQATHRSRNSYFADCTIEATTIAEAVVVTVVVAAATEVAEVRTIDFLVSYSSLIRFEARAGLLNE